MFLPLAHVFARFISVLAMAAGTTVAHTPDIKNLLPDLQSYEPTFILAVPRVFEKVYNSALTKAEDGGKGAIFHRAADTAIAYSKARQAGRSAWASSSATPCSTSWSTASCARPWAAQVAHAVSGGGPLGERLGHFFQGIGMQVLEGYGLTETTAPISVNTPSLIKIGSVGTPAARQRRQDRRRRRNPRQGRLRDARLLQARRPHRRDLRRRLVPYRRHRPARRRRLPDDHRPQEGNHRHGRRQERDPGPAGGPDPRRRAGLPGAGGG